MSKRFLPMVMLLVAVLATMVTFGTASAALDACRADPIILLSDGSIVMVTVQVGTPASNIEKVNYALHVPRGTSVNRIVYTGGALKDKEHVTFFADNPPNVFTTETTVTARDNGVQVTAQMRLWQGVSTAVSGFTNERLLMRLSPR